MTARLERFNKVRRELCLFIQTLQFAQTNLHGTIRISNHRIRIGHIDFGNLIQSLYINLVKEIQDFIDIFIRDIIA